MTVIEAFTLEEVEHCVKRRPRKDKKLDYEGLFKDWYEQQFGEPCKGVSFKSDGTHYKVLFFARSIPLNNHKREQKLGHERMYL